MGGIWDTLQRILAGKLRCNVINQVYSLSLAKKEDRDNPKIDTRSTGEGAKKKD